MVDLVRWLGEQLDEDERDAQRLKASRHGAAIIPVGDGDPIVIGGQWMLDDIASKRQIVAAYLPPGGDPHPGQPCTDDIEGDPDGVFYAEQHPAEQGACVRHLKASERLLHHDYVLRLLALPYADRPGYREEWAP